MNNSSVKVSAMCKLQKSNEKFPEKLKEQKIGNHKCTNCFKFWHNTDVMKQPMIDNCPNDEAYETMTINEESIF